MLPPATAPVDAELTQLVPFDVNTLPAVPGARNVKFGVVPPLDVIGAEAVTAVTVPPLLVELIVWFGQVPVMVTLVPATKAGVDVPVPPLSTSKTPPSVTTPVVAVEGVKPVVPPLKEDTPAAIAPI